MRTRLDTLLAVKLSYLATGDVHFNLYFNESWSVKTLFKKLQNAFTRRRRTVHKTVNDVIVNNKCIAQVVRHCSEYLYNNKYGEQTNCAA